MGAGDPSGRAPLVCFLTVTIASALVGSPCSAHLSPPPLMLPSALSFLAETAASVFRAPGRSNGSSGLADELTELPEPPHLPYPTARDDAEPAPATQEFQVQVSTSLDSHTR